MKTVMTKQSIIDAFHQLKAIPTHGRTFHLRNDGAIEACPIGVFAYLANPSLIRYFNREGEEVEDNTLEYHTGHIGMDAARQELDLTWHDVSEIVSAFDDAEDFEKNPRYGQLYDDVRAARNELRAEYEKPIR